MLFFFFGMVFVALLLTGNVLFFRYLNKLGSQEVLTEEEGAQVQSRDRNGLLISKIVSTLVTILGVMIGSISLIGSVIMAVEDNHPENWLYSLSLLFVISMIVLPRVNAVVRYTLLTIGYLTGMISIIWIDEVTLSSLFLVLSAAGWLRMEGRIQRMLTYALLNLNLGIVLHQLLSFYEHGFELIILILTILNAGLYGVHSLLKDDFRHQVRKSALFFSLMFLLWLTFFDDIFPYSYAFFNLVNFGAVTSLVFIFLRRNRTGQAAISLAFWFIFLAFKYYDLLWTLLHKSITLALLGFIAFFITYFFARSNRRIDR